MTIRNPGIRSVPSTAASGTRRRGGAAARRDGFWPWLFVLPLLFGVGLFYIWPILQTAFSSFTTSGVFGGFTWSGIANDQQLLADPQLWQSLGNTLIYTAIVLLGIPISVWLASLINTPGLRFAALYRVLFFLPSSASKVRSGSPHQGSRSSLSRLWGSGRHWASR